MPPRIAVLLRQGKGKDAARLVQTLREVVQALDGPPAPTENWFRCHCADLAVKKARSSHKLPQETLLSVR